jgi:hypothetical protein
MESTMAVDYTELEDILRADGPMFLHFAGGVHHSQSRIAQIFVNALTPEERSGFFQEREERWAKAAKESRWPLWVRVLNRIVGFADSRFHIQWRPIELQVKR